MQSAEKLPTYYGVWKGLNDRIRMVTDSDKGTIGEITDFWDIERTVIECYAAFTGRRDEIRFSCYGMVVQFINPDSFYIMGRWCSCMDALEGEWRNVF